MLKIRLRRMGARNSPFYRVVVSDSRQVPTGAAVEELGHYDPTKVPAKVTLDTARIDHWVGRGAQLSPTVKRLLHQEKQKSA
jgi:small subunit ribosomal protein S16